MAKPDKFVTATHPELGTMWACVEPTAVYPVGQVAERRFAAFLTPFRSRADAVAALRAAGCKPALAKS